MRLPAVGLLDLRVRRSFLSNEEQSREPNRQDEPQPTPEENAEAADQAKGSPEDLASTDSTAEDSGAAVNEEDIEIIEEDPEPDEPFAGGEMDLYALTEELEATRRERDEYLDALRRLKAEFENSRKRQEREKARILETAAERIIIELLPVLDNLDRALEHEGDIREGVRATRIQLANVLDGAGLLPVASDGQHFDPNVHEAVMSQPSEEHEEGTIVQTFERGYLLNGKPIRPAKVVVAIQG